MIEEMRSWLMSATAIEANERAYAEYDEDDLRRAIEEQYPGGVESFERYAQRPKTRG